jgi:fatty acid desaturase
MGAAVGALVLAGPGLVAHAWAVIVAAGALFVLWPNPLTYLLAVMLIGARQLGLAILMHEAAHGGLHPNLKVNDWVGEWLCAAPTGASLAKYRPYHLTHHKYAQQAEDPDLVLSAPFPTTRASPCAARSSAT